MQALVVVEVGDELPSVLAHVRVTAIEAGNREGPDPPTTLDEPPWESSNHADACCRSLVSSAKNSRKSDSVTHKVPPTDVALSFTP